MFLQELSLQIVALIHRQGSRVLKRENVPFKHKIISTFLRFSEAHEQGRKALLHVEAHLGDMEEAVHKILPLVKLRVMDWEANRELTFIPETSDEKLCFRLKLC